MPSRNPQIMHIVLFQFKPDTAPEAVQTVMDELRALKDKIPGILDISCGVNFAERAKNFTHGLVVRFTDRDALEVYGPHPEHQRVVQNYINPIRSDVLAFDYEL